VVGGNCGEWSILEEDLLLNKKKNPLLTKEKTSMDVRAREVKEKRVCGFDF